MIRKNDRNKNSVTNKSENNKYYEFVFQKDVKVTQILDLFEKVSANQDFCMIQSEITHAIAIKDTKKNIFEILDCFSLCTSSKLTAVKITILKSQEKNQLKCRIKRIMGSDKQLLNFAKCFNAESKELESVKDKFLLEEDVQIVEQQINPYYLEYNSFYTFNKILSNPNNQVGEFINKFIQNFSANFENELVEDNMKKILKVIDKVVNILNTKYNHTEKDIHILMPYCKVCVQRFVFQKTYDHFQRKYQEKNEDSLKIFKEKREKFLKTKDVENVLKEIGLRKHLWFIDEKNPQQCLEKMVKGVFGKCLKEISKITLTKSPREKINSCQLMFAYLKIIVYEKSGGRKELSNIEDIIPLLIMVLMCGNVENIKQEMDMMIDFMGNSTDFDDQKRLIINLLQSYNFIIKDWHWK